MPSFIQALASSATANAAETSPALCVPPRSVAVRVTRAPDEAMARRIEHEIESELASATSQTCWALPSGSAGAALDIEVRWRDRQHARVVIVAATEGRSHYAIRDVELQNLPDDGLPLAMAIATDELLETIGEQVSQTLALPLLPPPSPAPPASLPPPAPRETRRLAFGPAGAIDVIGSDLVLVGPDATLAIPMTSKLALALRLGARALVDGDRRSDLEPFTAWVAGASVRAGPQGPTAGFAISAGVDGMIIELRSPRRALAETRVVGRVGVAAFTKVSRGLRLTVDAYVGGTIATTRVMVESRHETFGGGVSAGGSVGLAAEF